MLCILALSLLAGGTDPLAGIGPVQQVATGFNFTEGPLWSDPLGGLLFSELDNPFDGCGGRIHLFTPPSTVTTFRDPSCNANGLARDGVDLIVAEHGSRSVTRTPAVGSIETVASEYMGTSLNAPNDVVVRSDGTIYFTDPDFVGPDPPELRFNGVYRVQSGTGTLFLETTLDGPNGLVLSPDESTLYVSDQSQNRVLSYDLAPDGSLSNPLTFATGCPKADGLTVDRDGNLYVAVETGSTGAILVFDPGGSAWGAISIPQRAKNCAFGGADRRTLYVTAKSLYAIQMVIPGANLPAPVPAMPGSWRAALAALLALGAGLGLRRARVT